MKKIILIVVITTAIFGYTNLSFGQTTFQFTAGLSGNDRVSDICLTNDGGYILCGTVNHTVTQTSLGLLMKLDEYGDTIWVRTYGDSISFRAVVESSNGDIFATGCSERNKLILLKVDLNGDLLWCKSYCNTTITGNGLQKLLKTNDDKLLSLSNDGLNFYIFKMDSNGDTSWTKIFHEFQPCYGNDVIQTSDSGFTIVGTGGGWSGTFMLKLNSQGDSMWTKSYAYVESRTFVQTNDGGYIVSSESEPDHQYFHKDLIFIKTDFNGNIMWTKRYGNLLDFSIFSSAKTNDGGILVTGSFASVLGGDMNVFLLKTDSLGTIEWLKSFGNVTIVSTEVSQRVKTTPDGYIIGGYTIPFSTIESDIYVIKTDLNGNSGCFESTAQLNLDTITVHTYPAYLEVVSGFPIQSFSLNKVTGIFINYLCKNPGVDEIESQPLILFPNPFVNEITIEGTKTKGDIYIFDITGKKMLQIPSLNSKMVINLNFLEPGVYLLKYSNSEERTITSIIKTN